MTGIVDLSIGATFLVFGAVMKEGTPPRGAMLGAGLGTLAVGVPMFAVGTQRVRYPRNSEAAYTVGTVLVSASGTLTGLGIGYAVGGRGLNASNSDHVVGAGFGVAGAVLGLTGAGLMAFGAVEASPEDLARRTARRRETVAEAAAVVGPDGKVPRSVPRRTAGQVLVTLGGASALGALASGVALVDDCGAPCSVLIVLPLAGQGAILTAIGVPLWVSGAARVAPEELASHDATPPVWTPSLSIGAGNLSMGMGF